MEISNKFLAFLLVFALVVSVGGTWYSVKMLRQFPSLTGYGTQGYVNVTIGNQSSLNVTQTSCNFSTGYITAGKISALLESNDTGTKENWSNSTLYTVKDLVIENDGNVNLSVTVNSGKSFSDFFGVDCSSNNCNYTFWSEENETGTCGLGALVAYPGYQMNTSNISVCDNMGFLDTQDTINISCRLVITQDIPTGAKGDIWSFTFTEVSP